MDIGARLQLVRKTKGLSQRELAKRVGVTNSTISLIEQNKVSPSVSSLKKVLDGIPISLADFFTMDMETGPVDSPFYACGEQPDVGNNDIHYFLIGQRRPQRQMCILREVTVGERVRVLGPGEAYYFESRIPHRFRNVGDEDAILFSANTPATF
jgi:transcriptional regulator with XRE-family HTH domain